MELLPENADKAKNVVKQAPNFVVVDGTLYFSDHNRHRVAVPFHLQLQDDDSTMARFEDISDNNVPEDSTEEDAQDDTDETVNKRYSLRNQDSIRLPLRYVNRVWDNLTP